MSNHWAWISGWAIAPDPFQAAVTMALPGFTHTVHPPTETAVDTVVDSAPDRIGGYSLGSLLLLSERQRLPDGVPLYCLAPFLGFCREFKMGGATPAKAVGNLEIKFKRDPLATIQVFHRLASIQEDPGTALPYAEEAMLWGLRQLSRRRVQPLKLERVRAVIGAADRLVAIDDLRQLWPTCRVVDGCGHDYRDLLPVMAAIDWQERGNGEAHG